MNNKMRETKMILINNSDDTDMQPLLSIISDGDYEEYKRNIPQVSFTRHITMFLKDQRKKLVKWFKTEYGKETDNINDIITNLRMSCSAHGDFYTKPQIKIYRYCITLSEYYMEEYHSIIDEYYRVHGIDDYNNEDIVIDYNKCKKIALLTLSKAIFLHLL